jgi:hypothetical protein
MPMDHSIDIAGALAGIAAAQEAREAAGGEAEENDEVMTATEAALAALQCCRTTYNTLLAPLLVKIEERAQSAGVAADDQEAEIDPWSAAAGSLARRVLRAIHGAENTFNARADDGQLVSLSDVEAVIAAAGHNARTFIEPFVRI